MIWTDFNGNEHYLNDHMEFKEQIPNCKYILPCGLCSLFPDLKTCRMMMYEVNNNERS